VLRSSKRVSGGIRRYFVGRSNGKGRWRFPCRSDVESGRLLRRGSGSRVCSLTSRRSGRSNDLLLRTLLLLLRVFEVHLVGRIDVGESSSRRRRSCWGYSRMRYLVSRRSSGRSGSSRGRRSSSRRRRSEVTSRFGSLSGRSRRFVWTSQLLLRLRVVGLLGRRARSRSDRGSATEERSEVSEKVRLLHS